MTLRVSALGFITRERRSAWNEKTPAWQKGQENCVIYRRRNAIPFNSYESPATGKYLRWFLSVTGEICECEICCLVPYAWRYIVQ